MTNIFAQSSGNPSVPKNSTHGQEEYSNMEVQQNTENVLNLNVGNTHKRYLCLCECVYLWLHSKLQKKVSTADFLSMYTHPHC